MKKLLMLVISILPIIVQPSKANLAKLTPELKIEEYKRISDAIVRGDEAKANCIINSSLNPCIGRELLEHAIKTKNSNLFIFLKNLHAEEIFPSLFNNPKNKKWIDEIGEKAIYVEELIAFMSTESIDNFKILVGFLKESELKAAISTALVAICNNLDIRRKGIAYLEAKNQPEKALYLLKNHANPRATVKRNSITMSAMHTINPATLEHLLKHGGNPNETINSTPMVQDRLEQNHYNFPDSKELATLFLNHGAIIPENLSHLAQAQLKCIQEEQQEALTAKQNKF